MTETQLTTLFSFLICIGALSAVFVWPLILALAWKLDRLSRRFDAINCTEDDDHA